MRETLPHLNGPCAHTVCLKLSFNRSVYACMHWVLAVATLFNVNATKSA